MQAVFHGSFHVYSVFANTKVVMFLLPEHIHLKNIMIRRKMNGPMKNV